MVVDLAVTITTINYGVTLKLCTRSIVTVNHSNKRSTYI